VVTSCSHRGIVGICQHATRITGVDKVHAVIGGFHTSGLGEERITRVVEAFHALGVDYVVPQHCTGIEAIGALSQRLPKETVASSVGSAFVFGG
jgi:7,8-dihydropterin-6-yl-methyl-4-(beta-D-ribofuranosyl)aminobenzene 5'-phosphate synthase